MFSGIVADIGRVAQVIPQGRSVRLKIDAELAREGLELGESVNINGACHTVVESQPGSFWVLVSPETLRRTTLGQLRPGDEVNLERAIQPIQRLGGHLVQGHVDGVGVIRRIVRQDECFIWSVSAPRELQRYIVSKGSITLDGVSLTVVDKQRGLFRISVIPYTLEQTTLGRRRVGDRVNLEVDILGKYVESLLAHRNK